MTVYVPVETSPKPNDSMTSHRRYVGGPESYDIISAVQFNLLTFLGLREYHTLLDIGCGSLRAGRLFIPYLLAGGYFGFEPERWLLEAAVRDEVGSDLLQLKQATFIHDDYDFNLGAFGKKFDYLLAHSIFSHTTQAQTLKCLAEAARIMHSKSIFVATFVEGETNYEGDTWALQSKYRYDFVEKAATQAGLRSRRIEWPSPFFQQWVVFALPENEDLEHLVSHGEADAPLVQELDLYRERLAKLESHPWVSLGIAVKRGFRWLGFLRDQTVRNAGMGPRQE